MKRLIILALLSIVTTLITLILLPVQYTELFSSLDIAYGELSAYVYISLFIFVLYLITLLIIYEYITRVVDRIITQIRNNTNASTDNIYKVINNYYNLTELQLKLLQNDSHKCEDSLVKLDKNIRNIILSNKPKDKVGKVDDNKTSNKKSKTVHFDTSIFVVATRTIVRRNKILYRVGETINIVEVSVTKESVTLGIVVNDNKQYINLVSIL